MMIDNTKEYIACAAYKVKKYPPHMQSLLDKGTDVREVYHEPHREVMEIVTGWRHPDIIWKFRDLIDRSDSGGFMTSKGRYLNRKDAMKLAYEAGQVDASRAFFNGKDDSEGYSMLYSEDIY